MLVLVLGQTERGDEPLLLLQHPWFIRREIWSSTAGQCAYLYAIVSRWET